VPKYISYVSHKIEDFSEFVAVFGRLDRGREDAGELENDTRAHLSFDEDLGGVVIHVQPATDAAYVRQEQVLHGVGEARAQAHCPIQPRLIPHQVHGPAEHLH